MAKDPRSKWNNYHARAFATQALAVQHVLDNPAEFPEGAEITADHHGGYPVEFRAQNGKYRTYFRPFENSAGQVGRPGQVIG